MKLALVGVFADLSLTPNGQMRLQGYQIDSDVFGMPVLVATNGAAEISYAEVEAPPSSVEHLAAAYGLQPFLVDDVTLYLSDLPAQDADGDAMALLAFVMGADVATARSAVIGRAYQLGAYQVAAHDQRPHSVTTNPVLDDIDLRSITTPYRGFYSLQSLEYAHRRFDQNFSPVLNRTILTTGDAVIVLPYDPDRGEVVLIEQIRPAALARRSNDAWGLEAVAGVIGFGETPEYTAQRELEEEAGLTAKSLYPLAPSYPSPGALSQFMYCYIAHVDLTDYQTGIFGLASEAEDIKSHLMSVDAALGLLRSGEINIMPLQYCLSMLALERAKIDAAFKSN